jgi:hypothetical protein
MKHGGIFRSSIFFLFLTGCSAAHYYPVVEGNCVDRAIAIREYMRKEGYKAEIVLGYVTWDGDREAHAWVKYKKPKSGEWKRINNLRAK